MAKIQNISSDRLGYNGLILDPGEVQEVPQAQAEANEGKRPRRFGQGPRPPIAEARQGEAGEKAGGEKNIVAPVTGRARPGARGIGIGQGR